MSKLNDLIGMVSVLSEKARNIVAQVELEPGSVVDLESVETPISPDGSVGRDSVDGFPES